MFLIFLMMLVMVFLEDNMVFSMDFLVLMFWGGLWFKDGFGLVGV